MINESKVIGIFPTPIYITKLNKKITSKELFFINKNKLNVYKNEGNNTSIDNYVLNNKIFKNIKKELNFIINDYFNNIICCLDKVKPYITQSWINYTEFNQYHHKHCHFNSLVSGVLYIKSDEEFDRIKFFKNEYNTFEFNIKEFNLYNSSEISIPVKTGDVILFPSRLKHMVEIKQGTNTRISLAFNVFIKGTLGENKNLNKIVL